MCQTRISDLLKCEEIKWTSLSDLQNEKSSVVSKYLNLIEFYPELDSGSSLRAGFGF
jgi:hypothetical protein